MSNMAIDIKQLNTAASTNGAVIVDADSGVAWSNSVTSALRAPAGTTAQRPGSPVAGHIRFNSTTVAGEMYDGTAWNSFGGAVAAATITRNVTGTASFGAGELLANIGGSVSSNANIKISTNQLQLANGTVAAPSLGMSTDGTTGLNYDGTTMSLVAAGVSSIDINKATGNVTVNKNLNVIGALTYIESTTLQVGDKNIEIGKVAVPTDVTADGGGVTLLGATNKTMVWDSATSEWQFNQPITSKAGATSSLGVYNATNFKTMFKAAAGQAADVTYTLPAADGTAGQVLKTDGAGALAWASPAGGGMVFKKFTVTANSVNGTVQIYGIGSQADCDASTVTASGTGDTITVVQGGSFILTGLSFHCPAGFNATTNIYFRFNCLNATVNVDDAVIPNIIHYNLAGVIQAQTNITYSNTGGVTQITKAGLSASAGAKWLMRT